MSIIPIGSALSALQPTTPAASTTSVAAGSNVASPGGGFGDVLTNALDSLSNTQSVAGNAAVQAATGTSNGVQNVMIASTEAALSTQLTVAVRDKAVTAFNSIMQMPV